jgi:hypothetical protein
MDVLRRFTNRYDKPPATDAVINDWFELFQKYDAKIIINAANQICLDSTYFPKPPQLNKAYWDIYNEHKKANAELAKSKLKDKDCKYCGGTGWFKTMFFDKTWSSAWGSYVCECVCQNGNPSNLNKALASDDYIWSNKERAFVPRVGWIGDGEEEQADIDFTDVNRYMGNIKDTREQIYG